MLYLLLNLVIIIGPLINDGQYTVDLMILEDVYFSKGINATQVEITFILGRLFFFGIDVNDVAGHCWTFIHSQNIISLTESFILK